jgi:hypothetical protein
MTRLKNSSKERQFQVGANAPATNPSVMPWRSLEERLAVLTAREPVPGTEKHIAWMAKMEEAYSLLQVSN